MKLKRLNWLARGAFLVIILGVTGYGLSRIRLVNLIPSAGLRLPTQPGTIRDASREYSAIVS